MKKLKINQLCETELVDRKMACLYGGVGDCCCSCNGPSSSTDNDQANYNDSLHSPGCTGDSCSDTTGGAESSDFWKGQNQ